MGLKHYTEDDARRALPRHYPPAATDHFIATNDLLALSGGHPGLLVALIDVLLRNEAEFSGDELASRPVLWPQVAEECRKL